ncbi:MerR family transcriptional regulator [Fictibacillus nanhaiensis]|uniref:MerR family transcriptional regulator n=1 Tax=Fictibacillus nanhaiensis TaxID=742169 RepID=UPI001C93A6FE|nr:MerR family transcriptional regulator [Fictibacillus nanhaiensis]MBY6035664.1 MerR family transcriptional regulator [Fictibacillus nanhaiensis]
MPCEGKYNIKAVSKMLGIQAGTLRAWERRYSIVQPHRNEAGHRLYTDEQVYILKWLVNKVNQGFTISQAVDVAQNGELYKEAAPFSVENTDRAVEMSNMILDALLSFQEKKANDLLSQAFSMYNLEKVIIDILGTLLVQVGYLWEQKKITVAHEHFTSSFLRMKIGQLMQWLPSDPHLPKVIASCGVDEEHELGLLMFTLFLRRKGFEVIYLGHGIPQEDLEVVINEVEPKMIFLSCTITDHVNKTFQWVENLQEKFPEIAFGVGGSAINHIPESVKETFGDFLIGNAKVDWDDWISKKLKK